MTTTILNFAYKNELKGHNITIGLKCNVTLYSIHTTEILYNQFYVDLILISNVKQKHVVNKVLISVNARVQLRLQKREPKEDKAQSTRL